ncbi:glycosyltransferase family 4 protein [Clostridium sp.]|uniref:glycosyltransferase family 4 protein n=1 Tax=Clostridium sp. TaxID=1506 RepID=UPI003464D0B7
MSKKIYFINWHNGLNILNGPTNIFNSLVKEIREEDNIEVISPEKFQGNFRKAILYLLKTLRHGEENIYCVNTDGLKMSYIVHFLSKFNKRHKYYMIVHGFRKLEDRFVGLDMKNYYRLEDYILRNFQNLICVSEFSKSIILEHTKRKKPSFVIHHGVDVIENYNIKEEKDIHNEIRLIMSGGVKKLKGALEAVNLVTVLNEKNKPYKITLDVYGKFDDDIFFNGFQNAIEGNDFVKYRGCIDKNELYEAYKKSHFLLALSYLDSFNMTVVEAMANGTVPILTDNVGACEFIGDKKDGFIVTLDNYYKKVEEILDLAFYNKEKYFDVAQKAYDKSKGITWRHKLEEYLKLLN